MPQRVANRFKFVVERLVLRGAHYRLLVIAAAIGLVSVLAGALVHLSGAGVEGGFLDAVWWAFLRLSDPGYLGDDVGTLQRIVSTVLTILGYVLFLGALVAIMTQWLNSRMRELEAGLTPVAMLDHILIAGWTNRTPVIVSELVMSGSRVRRFLQLHGARTLRLAILADEVSTALSVELRERLGRLWNERQVVLRTGSPLRLDHLRRVDFVNAAAVILPATDFGAGGPDHADARAIKTLLSMANHPLTQPGAELPLVVVEIFDPHRIDVARRAYSGPVEVLASDGIVARLIAQNVRHPGLSHVYAELLTHGHGNEIYVRRFDELAGQRFHELQPRFEQAVLLGIVTPEAGSFRPLLNPPADTRLREGDRLALIARSYSATQLAEPAGAQVGRAAAPGAVRRLAPAVRTRPLRVLVLGWNHKVPALLEEFDSYEHERFEIDIISSTPAESRTAAVQRFGLTALRLALRQIEADYTTPTVLGRAAVASYDSILLLGSDRFESGEDSDARSIMGYLLLRDALPSKGGPAVLVELLDPGNTSLFRAGAGEVIVSPLILSHMLAQVALRRELRAVFDELFGPGGAEIIFRSPAEYELTGAELSFGEIEAAVSACGEIALGVRQHTAERGDFALNPPRTRKWSLTEDYHIVILTTY